jgi:DNA-binding HxlR family transcriptional regulator
MLVLNVFSQDPNVLMNYNELYRESPYGSPNTLSDRLKDGEKLGIIKKEPVMPPGEKAYFHYVLIEYGQFVFEKAKKLFIGWRKVMNPNSI